MTRLYVIERKNLLKSICEWQGAVTTTLHVLNVIARLKYIVNILEAPTTFLALDANKIYWKYKLSSKSNETFYATLTIVLIDISDYPSDKSMPKSVPWRDNSLFPGSLKPLIWLPRLHLIFDSRVQNTEWKYKYGPCILNHKWRCCTWLVPITVLQSLNFETNVHAGRLDVLPHTTDSILDLIHNNETIRLAQFQPIEPVGHTCTEYCIAVVIANSKLKNLSPKIWQIDDCKSHRLYVLPKLTYPAIPAEPSRL